MSKEKAVANNNLAVWDSLRTPPPSALKKITGGRLSGMTDIKPQWRYQIMTERFGTIGFGWKYTTERLWTEAGSAGQVLAFAKINLFVKVGDVWSDAIEGIGGSTMVELESKGLHSSDEAFKMATTDALSVAMKMLGVGADIYLGLWDGSKYKDVPATKTEAVQKEAVKTATAPEIVEKKPVGATFESYTAEIKTALGLPHLKSIWDAVVKSKNSKEITAEQYALLTVTKDEAKERLSK